jgi:hypothetical protein
VKRLKVKARSAHNKRNLRRALSSGTETTIPAVAGSQETGAEGILRSVLRNEGKCWTEFNKYVKIRKGNRENTPVTKDCNGRLVTDSVEKANSLNSY